MPHFSADSLRTFAARLLETSGAAPDEARLVADSLVDANLRGHDSHGVMRIPFYLDAVKKGDVVPGAPLTALSESASLLAADGHWGFGQTQAQRLTRRLIALSQSSPIVLGTLIHSGHIGRLGEYCELAAEAGRVSLVMVNTHGHARRVRPPAARRRGWEPIPWPLAARRRAGRWCSTSAPAPRPRAKCG